MNEKDRKDYILWASYHRKSIKLKKGYSAVAYLEADVDIAFWDKVFCHFLPQYSFKYITYTKTSKGTATGCETCLNYFKLGCLSKEFFICIDSDYRWLLQEKEIDIKHFVFQTYTYSWENHYCYFENIRKLGFSDIKTLLEKYSKLLYRPFIYYLHSIKQDKLFSLQDFKSLLEEIKLCVNMKNLNSIQIDESKAKDFIANQIKKFKKQYRKEDIQFLESQCHKLGLNSRNAYLYFRGHDVFEFILEITKGIYKQREKLVIQNYTDEEKQIYFAQKKTPREKQVAWITENIYFDKYGEINNIKRDIEIYKQL
jgi:hypothetical protein